MKLIQELESAPHKVTEDAAGGTVAGGSVAMFAVPLIQGAVKRSLPNPLKITKITYGKRPKRKTKTKLSHFMEDISSQLSGDEKAAQQDSVDVVSKLKDLERKETVHRDDTATFGIEDENGGSIKVTIPRDQSEGFEQALSSYLASVESEEETKDVAEILYDLKDHFDIIDVEWGDVEEDEEENQQLETPPAEEPQDDAADMVPPAEATPPVTMDDATSILKQVIDTMRADADAKKAEAIARQKEAEQRTVKAAADMARDRVKQEEQMLDMEAWDKQKKAEEKEAKRLAKLAKWKHDMEKDRGMSFDSTSDSSTIELAPQQAAEPEEEELHNTSVANSPVTSKTEKIKGRVRPSDVASFILKRLK